MATFSITIRADNAAAMTELLSENGILTYAGGRLTQEIGLLHWYAGEAPSIASGWFWMGHWDTVGQGEGRRVELEEALGEHYWTGATVASVLGVPGYALPTGNERIKHERDKRIEAGGYKVGSHWFHSDKTSRDQHMRLAMKAETIQRNGGDMNAPFPNPAMPSQPLMWKTLGGPYVPMTPSLALQIVNAAEVQQAALHLTAAVAMQQGKTADQITWPETYSAT